MRKKVKDSISFSKGEVTFLAANVHLRGDIVFSGNLEIEGKVTGNILAETEDARVRVAPSGEVKGDITVSYIAVSGQVEGTLRSSGQIELSDGSTVDGNLHYCLLEVEKGAVVNGNFIQEQPGQETVNNRVEAITAIS